MNNYILYIKDITCKINLQIIELNKVGFEIRI